MSELLFVFLNLRRQVMKGAKNGIELVPNGVLTVQPLVLGQVADLEPLYPGNRSFVRRCDICDHFEEGGLAGSVAAH